MKHIEEARALWVEFVPPRGPAETVQGELLRSIEHLRDESLRNGNMNWGETQIAMLTFIRDRLVTDHPFSVEILTEISDDVDRALDFEQPAADEVYDRLGDRIVEWCRAHPPVTRSGQPKAY